MFEMLSQKDNLDQIVAGTMVMVYNHHRTDLKKWRLFF